MDERFGKKHLSNRPTSTGTVVSVDFIVSIIHVIIESCCSWKVIALHVSPVNPHIICTFISRVPTNWWLCCLFSFSVSLNPWQNKTLLIWMTFIYPLTGDYLVMFSTRCACVRACVRTSVRTYVRSCVLLMTYLVFWKGAFKEPCHWFTEIIFLRAFWCFFAVSFDSTRKYTRTYFLEET